MKSTDSEPQGVGMELEQYRTRLEQMTDTARYCRKMPDFAVPLSENVVCCRVKMSVLMGDDFCRIVLSAACAMGGGVVC